MQRFASISIKSESFLVRCNTPTEYKEALYFPRYGRHMTCPTTSSFGTSKPCPISRVMLLPMVSLANWTKKSERHSATSSPKHIYHSIVCIGELVAHKERDHWAVDALGAPHVGERPEKELIASFVDRIAQLTPQLVTSRIRFRRGGPGSIGITAQLLFDILEVPQRSRGAGACRRLPKLMAELGWMAVRVRGSRAVAI